MAQLSHDIDSKKTLYIADYAVVACTLALSAVIGLYYAIKDRKKNTTDEYLLGGREMHPFPVTMSLTATFISALTILGIPAEVYVHSTMYWWLSVGIIVCSFGAGHIFVPIFYNLQVTSVFQYVEMRFGKVVRTITTVVYLINMILYMSIVLYMPSLALNAVTGLSLWGSVILVGAVCIFYTTLGGLKAVIWTDTLQMIIMYIGTLTLLIRGSVVLGGFGTAWEIADRGDRIVLTELNADPRIRHSVWTIVFGGGILWGSNFGTNQAGVQRLLAVRSLKHLKLAVWLTVPGITAIVTLTCLLGIVMYAYYADCDPLRAGIIERHDQMVPLYLMELLGDYHGVPGLFLSAIFSGSLSSLSSGLNAISAVILEDFAKPFCCNRISPAGATILSRAFVVVFGLLALLFSFVVAEIGGLVLQLTYTLFGTLSGPLTGVFVLGMLFPWSNKFGCLAGYFTSLVLLLWIGIATTITKTSIARWPPVSTEGCMKNSSLLNVTDSLTTVPETTLLPEISTFAPETTTSIFDQYSGIQQLYSLSYLWYATLGIIITSIVGLVVSLLTGPTDPVKINPKLICPFFDICFSCLPEVIRKPLRFGVRHGEVCDDANESLTEGIAKEQGPCSLTRKGPDGAERTKEKPDTDDAYEMADINPDFHDPALIQKT